MEKLPSGYRFVPEEWEVIEYLKARVENPQDPVPDYIFNDKDLYDEREEWMLPFNNNNDEMTSDDDEKDRQVHYFFTTLEKKSSQRIKRTAGPGRSGTWRGETVGKKIYDPIEGERKLVGLRKAFSYIDTDRNRKREWKYIMHEYSLLGDSLKELHLQKVDIVLCGISRKRPNGYKKEEGRRPAIGIRKRDDVQDCDCVVDGVLEAAVLDRDGQPVRTNIRSELDASINKLFHLTEEEFQRQINFLSLGQ